MRLTAKSWTLLALTMALGVALVVGGCGKKIKQGVQAARAINDARDGDFTIKGEDGQTVHVQANKGDAQSGEVTVTDEKGVTTTSRYGKDVVKQEDVGVDFYPGAEVQSGSNVTAGGEDAGTMATVQLSTKDPFDKVAKFYKDKYAKGNTVVEQKDNLMITIQSGDNAGKMIMVSPNEDEGTTEIVIHSASDM